MEEINNNLRMKQSCTHFSTSPSLAIHKDSKTISKVSTTKPKIRIIHIFAPEIIKTDVANFRELVQRLTGKPTEKDQCGAKNKIIKPRNCLNNIPRTPSSSSSALVDDHLHDHHDGTQDSKNKLAHIPYKPTVPIARRSTEYLKSSSTTGFIRGFDFIARSDQRVKEEEGAEEEEEEVEAHGMWDINGHENISSTGFLEGFIGFEELGEFPNLMLPSLDASHVMQFGFGGPQLV
ncbi:VQ motif containing protein [Parasponia andersonii]|uniref:VQ motif containing protein n=1 Tax=Parasponia andersonii TaxID=3476 RepID=A0A2P5B6V4_PARAD|nr:VQ motif containing protein [Parasponia andersonii]